jgi:hypothetical protein
MQAGERAGFESLMPLICHRARNYPGPAGAEPGGDTKRKPCISQSLVFYAEHLAESAGTFYRIRLNGTIYSLQDRYNGSNHKAENFDKLLNLFFQYEVNCIIMQLTN